MFSRSPAARRRWFWRALVLMMAIGLCLPPAVAGAAQEETDDDAMNASTLTVNVELILDASGSMAELIPETEDQTRMDAAKAAMRDVIDRIPERDGLNVGFRIYGHEGSSDEADRAVSCRSTELLVPLDGVDRRALRQQVDTFEPTGWTPLALALESAAADFAPGESVTNAIIMVTDGEETCGGDPCQVAGALHTADIALTTHVVGFALSDEQQEAVRCIAEEGGGQLFAAGDAASLSDAVFAALAQVESSPEPVEVAAETAVGGYVGGNAFGLLDEGTPGELSVVAVGKNSDGSPALVIRNDTGEDVENVKVDITVRSGGELVASGQAQGVQPFIVEDGEVALAYSYFSGAEIPEDAEYEFALSADPAGTDEITGVRGLVIEEINGTADGVVAILANPHEETIAGFIIGAFVCFDESGQAVAFSEPALDNDGLAPGETTSVQLSNPMLIEACPYYLVAAYGSAAE